MAAGRLPVQLATRVLAVSESGYYEWRGRAPSRRAVRHAWLTEQIQAVHQASRGTYGSRRVHAELTLGLGITIGHGAIELLMRRAGIKGLPGNRRRRPKHQTPTAGDLVHRQFSRAAPDQLWVTDITEHPTREGKVYCAVVLDTFARRVVGWSIDSSQTAALVTSALDMAIRNRAAQPGLLIHFDHGVQYTSWAFADRARATGLLPSMGSIGDCYDCEDRVVLGPHADRAAQPPQVADPPGTGQRDLRIPRDLPQPPAPPLRPRNAHPDRIRTAPQQDRTRSMSPQSSNPTPGNPGHIRASGNSGPIHSSDHGRLERTMADVDGRSR
jgi:putative transposase